MAHRYWRVRTTRAHVTTLTAAEVEFRSTPGGADQTVSGVAASASTLSSGTAAGAFANDGATTSANWTASTTLNGMNTWLAYDFGLGNEKDIVEFAWTIGSTASRNPRDCLLEFSDDAVFWSPYGNPFVEIAAAAANATTVYTASGAGAETIPKMGSFVVGALWPFDGTTVWKTGYQVVLEVEGASVVKHGYFVAIAPTDGLKVADSTGYVAFERLPSIQVADINGYVVFRPIPTPPRKTIVIIGPGAGFGGSGVDNPLAGVISQDQNFSTSLRLPQNMQAVVTQDSDFNGDLFVDNEVEDIFLVGAMVQTGVVNGVVYIPSYLSGSIDQETVVDADLFVDSVIVDHFLEGNISKSSAVEGSLTIPHTIEGSVTQSSDFVGGFAIVEPLEGAIEQTSILSGSLSETIPHEETFTSAVQITDFELRATSLDFLNETFATDSGQFTYATEGTLGTPISFTSGQGVLVHSGVRSSICFNGPDIQIPQVWVQMDMVSRAVNPAGYDVIGVGVGLDANNFIVGVMDRRNNSLRAQVKIAGSNTNYINLTFTGTTPGQIGVGIVNNTISIWTTNSIGGAWTLRGTADYSAKVDFRDTDLTGWKSCIFLSTGGAQTWTLDNFISGRFGAVGIRDISLISHEDGSPVDFSGKFRFTASLAHTTASTYTGVVEYDPVADTIQIVGMHYVDRGGKLYNDHAAHLVKNDDNTFRYLTSTWGNGFGGVIQILHKNNVGDLTSGVHIVSSMTQLSLPLIPGSGSGGAYDPYLIKHEGNWILAYAVVDNTTFAGENFYVAAASSSDMISFSGIGSDASRTKVEGPKIAVANGVPYIHAGGRGQHPTYDITMAYLGEPAFSPVLYNGLDTQPHIQIVPYNDKWLTVTWNQVRFNSVAFTWGDFLVYEAPRY